MESRYETAFYEQLKSNLEKDQATRAPALSTLQRTFNSAALVRLVAQTFAPRRSPEDTLNSGEDLPFSDLLILREHRTKAERAAGVGLKRTLVLFDAQGKEMARESEPIPYSEGEEEIPVIAGGQWAFQKSQGGVLQVSLVLPEALTSDRRWVTFFKQAESKRVLWASYGSINALSHWPKPNAYEGGIVCQVTTI